MSNFTFIVVFCLTFWRVISGFITGNHSDLYDPRGDEKLVRQLLIDRTKYNPFQEQTVSQYYQHHVCNQKHTKVVCGFGSWKETSTAAPCYNIGSFSWHNCCHSTRVFTHSNGKKGNGTMHSILKHWTNKMITFSGDSLSQQTFHSIVTAIMVNQIPFSRGFLEYEIVNNQIQKMEDGYYCYANHPLHRNQKRNRNDPNYAVDSICNPVSVIFIDKYNVTINYLFSYEQSIPSDYIPSHWNTHGFNHLPPQIFEFFTQLSDSMIVNLGAHYQGSSTILFTQILHYYRHVLELDLENHPEKKHIYRLTYPSHFGVNSYYEIKSNNQCVQDGIPTWTSEIAKSLFGDKIYVLDYYDVMKSQGDLHSRGKPDDCLHWCYSYELFYPLYQLITKIYNPAYDFES